MADLSYQDVFGASEPEVVRPDQKPRTSVSTPVSVAPNKEATYEQVFGSTDTKPLSRGQDASSNASKFLTTGAVKALSHLPGIYGDMAELSEAAENYLEAGANKLREYMGKPHGATTAAGIATERKGKPSLTPYIPSGQTIQNLIFGKGVDIPHTNRYVPGLNLGQYEPESAAGRISMAGLEALTPSTSGKRAVITEAAGLVPKALESTKNYLTRSAAPQAAAGLAGQSAYELTGSPLAALPVAIIGHRVGSNLPRIVEAHLSPTRMSEALAGQTLRSSASDLNKVQSVLNQTQPNLFEGMIPTLEHTTRDPGLSTLSAALSNDPNYSQAKESSNAILKQNAAAYNQSANQLIDSLDPKIQNHLESEMPSVDPKTGASTAAHNAYSQLEQNAFKAQETAWNDLFKTKINIYTKKTLNPLLEYITSLPKAYRSLVSEADIGVINDIQNIGSQAPLQEVQALRSRLLNTARNSTNSLERKIYGDMADRLHEAISNDKNVVFGGMADAKNRWQAAIDQTRNYHEMFREGALSDIRSGKISPETVLQTLLSSKDKLTNLKLLREATGNAVDPSIAEYMLARFTNNGTKIPTADQVVRELKGDNASIYAAVPEARLKLENLYKVAKQNDAHAKLKSAVKGSGEEVSVDPTTVLKALQEHRITFNELASRYPELASQLNKLGSSSKFMSAITADPYFNSPEYEALRQNAAHKYLYGKDLPIMTGLAGATALGGAHHYLGWSPLDLVYGTGAILGSSADLLRPNSLVGRLFSGKVGETTTEILNEARRNPEYARQLINAPKLESTPRITSKTGVRGVGTTALSEQRQEKEKAEQEASMQHDREAHPLFSDTEENIGTDHAPVPVTENDIDALTKAIISEAGNESSKGMAAVAHVILNRAKSGEFGGDDISSVISAPHQFEAVSSGAFDKADQDKDLYEKIKEEITLPVLRGEIPDPTNGATYYLNKDLQTKLGREIPSWAKSEGEIIGHHTFYSKKEADENREKRASGGKVGKSVDYLVNRLMTMAKTAKKISDKGTEPLLNAPDEAIVKALDVAQQAI